jgi:hypothetical protein
MSNNVLLLSKCVAGGLSAALVLLWWPMIAPGDSLLAWLGRGVGFTLSFELLLLGLRPLEQALWATSSGTRVRERVDARAERLREGDSARRLGSSGAIAALVLAVPAVLILAGLNERPGDAQARTPGQGRPRDEGRARGRGASRGRAGRSARGVGPGGCRARVARARAHRFRGPHPAAPRAAGRASRRGPRERADPGAEASA